MATATLWRPLSVHSREGLRAIPKPQSTSTLFPHTSYQLQCLSLLAADHFSTPFPSKRKRFLSLALLDEKQLPPSDINGEGNSTTEEEEGDESLFWGKTKQTRPCELYICNIPRSCDISQIAGMLNPFGTVLSVELCRDPKTGESKGCAYATMGAIDAARNAVRALDGSDVGGREMRVRYAAEMKNRSDSLNKEAMNSAVTKVRVYEGAHQLYVGNLPFSVTPDELKEMFSAKGRVLSVKLLYDRREGRKRAYGFLSFDSADERDAALSLNRAEFQGRVLAVRKGVPRSEALQ